MSIERYREIFKDKAKKFSDKTIAERIAQDRQIIRKFMHLVVNKRLTLSTKN